MDPNLNTYVDAQDQQQEALFKQLYDSLTPTIWVVRMRGGLNAKILTTSCTAFAVTKHGLLMSCAHGTWPFWDHLKIEVRCLDGNDGFEFEAVSVAKKRESDMSFFQIVNGCELKDNQVVKFGSGDLNVGEKVISIGHPHSCTGAGLIGHVVYQCTKNTDYELDDLLICKRYVADALTNTPLYMIMGHFLNEFYFRGRRYDDMSFEEGLQANLPVIQCSGLVGGEGASGAPIFNVYGEVVGIFISRIHGFDLGVHVTAMKKFLDQYLNSKNKGLEDGEDESQEDAKGKGKEKQ